MSFWRALSGVLCSSAAQAAGFLTLQAGNASKGMAPGNVAASLEAAAAPKTCQPWWIHNFSDCPYGSAGIGEVTWPDYGKAKRMGISLYHEFDVPMCVLYLCVFWSYMPYVLAFVAILKIFCWESVFLGPSCLARFSGTGDRGRWAFVGMKNHGTKELAYGVLLILIVGLSECVFKRLSLSPRPSMSCLSSCGMPSSHSALAAGTISMGLMDFAVRSAPRRGIGMLPLAEARSFGSQHVQGSCRLVDVKRRGFRTWCKTWMYDPLFTLQMAPFDEPSGHQLIGYALVWSTLMLPVPFSRIQLSDHTPTQALAGSALGVLIGMVYYVCVYWLVQRHNHRLGQRWPAARPWAFVHNFGLPCSAALVRCNPYSIGPKAGYEGRVQRHGRKDPPHSPPFRWLQESIDEVEWYRGKTIQRKGEMVLMGILTHSEDLYLKARYCRITELLELLTLEKWLLEHVIQENYADSVLQSFLTHLTGPDPVGLGLQSRAALMQLSPEALLESWRPEWEEDRSLAEQLCAWRDQVCHRSVFSPCSLVCPQGCSVIEEHGMPSCCETADFLPSSRPTGLLSPLSLTGSEGGKAAAAAG